MARASKTILHHFYCSKCGNRGIDLQRKTCKDKGKFHKKKLWCIYCKDEINHIECRNEAEIIKFKQDFKEGVYNDEAENSLSHVRLPR